MLVNLTPAFWNNFVLVSFLHQNLAETCETHDKMIIQPTFRVRCNQMLVKIYDTQLSQTALAQQDSPFKGQF